ncbi:queuosine precursor transporter [Croceicoccus sp. BE223]|uniref:queuosine precursor transporter n=1 Tax=Croceicoccus sp. BE223 TaxID=2817716 RepID=UPI0028564D72|nr:queuosine precursor transporter [Croceicoccus sp. BE223]MDR7101652.1 putative integral membrane protein (TIGR00697 family) [Croceicoccus sp. BE223]
MTNSATDTTPQSLIAVPRGLFAPGLFAIAVFYGGMCTFAGVLGNKQVALGPLAVEAGMFGFLFLVAMGGAVAEVYGRVTANKLVLWGFVPILFSIVLAAFVKAMPASPEMDPDRLAAIDSILSSTWRIWIAGPIAYGTSQLLNITVISAIKTRFGGPVWLRAGLAGALSQAIDTLLFVTIAFYGVFPIGVLLAGQMIAKVVLSLVLIPVLVTGFAAIARKLDARV